MFWSRSPDPDLVSASKAFARETWLQYWPPSLTPACSNHMVWCSMLYKSLKYEKGENLDKLQRLWNCLSTTAEFDPLPHSQQQLQLTCSVFFFLWQHSLDKPVQLRFCVKEFLATNEKCRHLVWVPQHHWIILIIIAGSNMSGVIWHNQESQVSWWKTSLWSYDQGT